MQIREVLATSEVMALEADVLLAHVLKRPRSWLIAHDNEEISEDDMTLFALHVARRKKGEPVAYITGEKEFYGQVFRVTSDVLIPRPATEELVENSLTFLERPHFIEREVDTGISVLCVPLVSGIPDILVDIGTGSGCIAATLALEGRKEKILAVDSSEAALNVAKENFSRFDLEIATAVGDGPAFVHAMHQPFFLISNPPYIAEGTTLERDVANFEPHEALFSGNNGMDMLAALARSATENPLCLGIALELETRQAAIVKRLLGVM